MTHRPLEQVPQPEREIRLLTEIDRTCDVVTLPTLPPNSMAELVLAHGHRRLPPDVVDALTAATGGIPLHAVTALADEIGTTLSKAALAWTLVHPAVTAPIVGARTLTQLEDNLGTLDVRFTADQLATLDEASGIDLGFPHEMLHASLP